MKQINYIVFIVSVMFLISCEYDNYDGPSVKFTGSLITASGDPFFYDGNPGRGLIKVIQKGFGKTDGGTNVRVDERGNYAQLLFPGEYWLTLENNPYPFEVENINSLGAGLGYDSIKIDLKSDLKMDFKVTPYYLLTDFTAKVENNNIVLNCNVTKNPDAPATAPKVTFGRGYVSTTSIVNGGTLLTRTKRAVITDSGSFEVVIPIFGVNSFREIYTNNFKESAYCRVSVELEGIPSYYLFSNITKIENVPLTP
ncbi:MAG: hypothetical protein BWY08_00627 [Bacteroidetes bacterium ADurb.Bin174]|jgi:hypothetical protein|nr:DUF3823 domain-containing protein [Bacteroidales bacterium]OQB31255.1 MAG: hypothetical protein BWY08_00627 [Bacteroidetes bacterium ADurb.Bin174]